MRVKYTNTLEEAKRCSYNYGSSLMLLTLHDDRFMTVSFDCYEHAATQYMHLMVHGYIDLDVCECQVTFG